ncbi:MAG: hypothetical protein AAF697_02070 [Pseudomonadota bacterium]
MSEKVEVKLWLIGVLMLVALIAVLQTLTGDGPYGIVDHQAAARADRVNEIQGAWKQAGHFGLHTAGMVGDLIFIVVYSLGTWRAGRGLRAQSGGFARLVGAVVGLSAVVFFATDICETSLQLTQMVMDQGVEWMAATAAFMQPIKVIAWIVSFVSVLLGLAAARFSRGKAA